MGSIWIGLGFLGQAAFSGRFLVQWVASERAGRSLVPTGFWYLSIVGSALLLAYAVHQRDPVFTVGQSAGMLIYLRNLLLVHREEMSHAGT